MALSLVVDNVDEDSDLIPAIARVQYYMWMGVVMLPLELMLWWLG